MLNFNIYYMINMFLSLTLPLGPIEKMYVKNPIEDLK